MFLADFHLSPFGWKSLFFVLISFSRTTLCQNSRSEVIISPEYTLGWEITTDGETIMFDVTAATTGWVGLGISRTGSMANADIFIGGFDPNSPEIFYSQDYFGGAGNGQPEVDTTRDWFLNMGNENSTHTELYFDRKLSTGDTQDIEIPNGEIFVIWALGSSDTIGYHSARGYRVLNLNPTGATTGSSSTPTSPLTTTGFSSTPFSAVSPTESSSLPTSPSTTRAHNSSCTDRAKLLTVVWLYIFQFILTSLIEPKCK